MTLNEAVHGAAERLDFFNRLFKFLVEEFDFAAIVLESGVVEGRIVNDYVLGGSGTLDSVLAPANAIFRPDRALRGYHSGSVH